MPETSTETPSPTRSTWRPLQLTGLALIAGLTAYAFVTANAIVRQQETTTHLISLAARQVMLTERIAGLSVELATHSNLKRQAADPNKLPDQAGDDAQDLSADKAEEKTRDDLRQAIALMQVAHQALINGSDDLKVAKPTADAVNKVYFAAPYNLDHQVVYFLQAANKVADTDPGTLNPESQELSDVQLAAREDLIGAESAAVTANEAEGTRLIARLKRRLDLSLGVLLVVALLEIGGLVVGKPRQ